MKKIVLVLSIVGVSTLLWLGKSAWFSETTVSRAQTSDAKYQKLLERDKNVPKEKVERAFAEAKQIQDNILATIAEKKPKLILYRTSARHLKRHNPGQRGGTHNEMTWRSTSKTQLSIQVNLGFKPDEELISFREGLQHISMGEFFKIPNIGDEAILVKNVVDNTRMTNVGLHFVKGRAQVDVYLTNHNRKTEKNEKLLMEVVRLIEPLIVARSNFDD